MKNLFQRQENTFFVRFFGNVLAVREKCENSKWSCVETELWSSEKKREHQREAENKRRNKNWTHIVENRTNDENERRRRQKKKWTINDCLTTHWHVWFNRLFLETSSMVERSEQRIREPKESRRGEKKIDRNRNRSDRISPLHFYPLTRTDQTVIKR